MMKREEDGNNYIQHHGIKGQKWGIRRYQNPDGSLTAEGMRRYGLATKGLGNHFLDYTVFGTASSSNRHRKRFYKDLKKNPDLYNAKNDIILKEGHKFYRTTPNKNEKDLKDVKNLYVASNEKDAATYGKYLLSGWRKTSNQYMRQLTGNEEIKAPSVMKMKKYAYEAMKNKDMTEEEFEKAYSKMSKNQKIKLNNYMHNLNSIIPDKSIDPKSKEKLDKFLDKIKNDNYNAIQDVHDAWYTNDPLIIIDADKSVKELDTTRVGAIEKQLMYTYGKYTYDELMKDVKHNDEDDDYLEHHGVKGMKWGVRNEEEPVGRPRYSRSQYEGYAKRYKLSKNYVKNIKKSKRFLKSKWKEYHALLQDEYGSKRKYMKENLDQTIADKMGVSLDEYKIGKNVTKLNEGKAELYASGKAAVTHAMRYGVHKLLQKAGIKEEKDMNAVQAGMLALKGATILKGTVSGTVKMLQAEQELNKIDLDKLDEERQKKKNNA